MGKPRDEGGGDDDDDVAANQPVRVSCWVCECKCRCTRKKGRINPWGSAAAG